MSVKAEYGHMLLYVDKKEGGMKELTNAGKLLSFISNPQYKANVKETINGASEYFKLDNAAFWEEINSHQ